MARLIHWSELEVLFKEVRPNEYGDLLHPNRCRKLGEKIIFMREDMKKLDEEIKELNEKFLIKASEINNKKDNEIKKLLEKNFDKEKIQQESEKISENVEKKLEKAVKKLEKFKIKKQQLNTKIFVKISSLKGALSWRFSEDPRAYEKRTGKKYVIPTLEELKGTFGENKK